MLKVLFFAQIRELVGVDEISVSAQYSTVEALRLALMEKGERWQLALESDRVLAAVNQTIVSRQQSLSSGDEVAFFPPVTGG